MAWKAHGGEPPVYIVGTEVPVPGGATEELSELTVTTPSAAEATIAAHKSAFELEGLQDAWPRVIGLVVQPGVEFDHDKVVDYISSKAKALSDAIQPYSPMVFEAHSTDYQLPVNLKALVKNHFSILKVGPGVTFAMREAIWALDALEQEWLGETEASGLKDILLNVMNSDPRYWQSYYHSKGRQLEIEKQFSFSDRIRYYWPHKNVESALNRMRENFKSAKPPLTLLSQVLPAQYLAVREGRIPFEVDEIVINKIQEVLSQYSDACMH